MLARLLGIFVFLVPCSANADEFYGSFIGYLEESLAVFILVEGDPDAIDVLACQQTQGNQPYLGGEYMVSVQDKDYVSSDIFETPDQFNGIALFSVCRLGG